MEKTSETGKSRLLKGSLSYFWEELKTLNRAKLRALWKILSGYVRLKWDQFRSHQRMLPK
jgi:hypothetical protein